MKAKQEIYEVRFNKYKVEGGDVGYNRYVLEMGYDVADMKIIPVKIELIKDRVHVSFSDGGKHIFFYGEDTELFYRTIKPKTDDGSTTED